MKQLKSNSKDNDARRKVLKGLVSTGGIAGAATITSWSKPVVESVLLPAHAITSVILPDEPALRTFALAGTSNQNMNFLFRPDTTQLSQAGDVENKSVLDRFIPSAQAQGFSSGDMFESVLFETATGVFTLQLLASETSSPDCTIYAFMSAAGLTEGVSGSGDFEDCTGTAESGIPVTVDSVTANSARVTIDGLTLGTLVLVANANPLSLTPCPCFGINGGLNGGVAE